MYIVHITCNIEIMNIKLQPETRRIIVAFAAKEDIAFEDAMEILICEGVKTLNHTGNIPNFLVCNSVCK